MLGDIRWCIDDLLAGGADPLLIVNLDRDGTFVDDRPDPLVLKRLEHDMRVTSGGPELALASIRTAPAGTNVLVSGLRVRDLRALAPHLSNTRPLLGFRREVGYWLLVGPSVERRGGALAFPEIDARRHGTGHGVTAVRAATGRAGWRWR